MDHHHGTSENAGFATSTENLPEATGTPVVVFSFDVAERD
jgi:hypothetical protein